jgi:tRNA wybutosine-synthesizing protein 4
MLKHFDKLNTTLKSVHKYPNLEAQERRFSSRGWSSVRTWTLWEAWQEDIFQTSAERLALDDIEPFDEGEELALFASHYFVLYAQSSASSLLLPPRCPPPSLCQIPSLNVPIAFFEAPQKAARRFGAAMNIRNSIGERFSAHLMGVGTSGRLRSCDIYGMGDSAMSPTIDQYGPPTRMCHATQDLGDFGALLIGGRTSPSKPLADCWLFRGGFNSWERAHTLPNPLFRHSSVRLGDSSLVLLAGGKTSLSVMSKDYLLYSPEKGWLACELIGEVIPPNTIGPVLSCFSGDSMSKTTFRGLLAGGMLQDGVINTEAFVWELTVTESHVGYMN